jgi:hypothetical protein
VRLWDTFLFRDELDMLECRLVQFERYPVYRHVLVEAPVDHRGHPKPLHYAENRERFAPWADQIVHVVADELADMGAPSDVREQAWQREAAQREAIGRGLDGTVPDDQVILADVDEIPNASAITAVMNGWAGVMEMTCCIFAVDWVWDRLKTSPVARVGAVSSFTQSRRGIWSSGPVRPDSGHHLTWLGGADAVRVKLAGTCHTEDVEEIAATLPGDVFFREGANPFGKHGYQGPLNPVDVDETWPRWVWERRCPPNWFRPRLQEVT